jgi:hypothetical protein
LAALMRSCAALDKIGLFARISVLGLLAALLGVPALATTAHAAQFPPTGAGSSPSGYTVSVRIHFYGSGVPGGSIFRRVRVHPTCYWAPADGPYTDAVAMLAWYDEVTGGLQTRGILDQYGPRSEWKKEADAEAAGTADISWYRAHCDNPADYNKFGVPGLEVGDPIPGNPANFVTFLYHPFNAGEAIPPPLVTTQELARVARNQLRIQKPQLEWNPKIDSAGAPTLVGLPTWFWVTNPLAVGMSAGNRPGTLDVTAELNQPAGPIWAKVTATTNGLHIDSAFGSTDCNPPALALVAYSPGLTDNQACTVVFTHAAQGLAVQASTLWDAHWTGSDGAGGGLAGAAQVGNFAINVAEVQNIVTR